MAGVFAVRTAYSIIAFAFDSTVHEYTYTATAVIEHMRDKLPEHVLLKLVSSLTSASYLITLLLLLLLLPLL
jgi:hypothetical protein